MCRLERMYWRMTTFELHLRTSNIQRSVSQQGVLPIWFRAYEEYVIDMDTMVKDHGIHMAPMPVEVLSFGYCQFELQDWGGSGRYYSFHLPD